MTTPFNSLATLSERELLDHFACLVARDRRTTVELLVAIAEIDERKLWAAHACSSMFTFCIERFHMSEQVTAKRIWAARTARRFPTVLDMVARGDLHLSAIHLLAKHLTEENHASVLERARHKSCREVEQLIAELAPRPDVPSRIRALPGPRVVGRTVDGQAAGFVDAASTSSGAGAEVDASAAAAFEDRSSSEHSASADPTGSANSAGIPWTPGARAGKKPILALSPRRYKVEITVDEATHDKLRSLQDLLARTETGRDPAAIISRAIDVLLERTLARKAACTERPKPAKRVSSATPTKPATPTTPTTPAMPMKSATPPSPPMPSQTGACVPTKAASDVTATNREPRSRVIPAAVRREVWRRDCGRCCYVDVRGRRCRETSNVEFHHKAAFALGGLPTTENIELRCAAHNQFQADLDFGRTFMDARRGKVAAA